MADVICPDCQGTRLEKYGKTKAGLQKYRCLDPGCRRQFVVGSDHNVADKTKVLVNQLLAENIKPRAIAKALTIPDSDTKPPISLRSIYELKRRMKNGGQS